MDHAGHSTEPETNNGLGYETRDASSRAVLISGIVLVAFLIAVILAMLGVFDHFVSEGEAKSKEELKDKNLAIYEQLHQLRVSEKDTLSTYGWVDRKAGVVRIPIERAFELVEKRGVPKGKGPRTEIQLNSRDEKK